MRKPERSAESDRPSRYSWRRWKATRKLSGWLYVMGLTYNGGSASWNGGDPHGVVYSLPWFSPFWTHRPYVLGKRDWWWRCLRDQFPRFTHWPGPEVMQVCGTCAPWQCCGAAGWEHKADCPDHSDGPDEAS